jgi:NAD(P)-dependent dehydrogenase (short-subunit alcohol dehydrogenase family)
VRLRNRCALVVDAGRDLGRAVATAFAAEGAQVALGEREEGEAAEIVEAIDRNGGRAFAVALDPLDPASCEAAVQTVLDQFGSVDVLCNVALHSPSEKKRLHDTFEAEWDEIFAETVTAVALPTRAALKVMKTKKGGSIIVIGSSAALVGVPGVAAFSGCAGVLTNWTRNLALDGSRNGIRANLLCLGSTWDPIVPSLAEEHAANRVSAEELAPTIVFLASDDSRHVTGQVIAADDGMTAWRVG